MIRALCTRNMRWLKAQGAKVASQDVPGCLKDYLRLVDERLRPAAEGSRFEPEVERIRSEIDKMLTSREEPSIERLFEAITSLGDRAEKEGLEKLKFAADHAYSILQPGEARAFVEFSPAFALEAEDLAEVGAGEGWVLEDGCQVAFTGHPTQVIVGRDFTARRNSVFILDIENEYGGVSLSSDRWLTFELDKAGSAEIGDGVTVEEDAVIEIHVHGNGRVEIPEGTVLKGEQVVHVPAGRTVTLGE